MVQETIEIGAYKMDRYGEVSSYFKRFIRPILHPQLSLFCRQLTSIEQPDVNRAREFTSVIEDFQDWVDIWGEEYLLCSWGGFDQRLLRQDCELHRLETEWLESFINVKQQYHDIRGLHRRRGLKRAVEAEGFEWEGEHHRALPDAMNLTKLFRKYLDMWRY
jgi:3'-5' exoribonuclease 1